MYYLNTTKRLEKIPKREDIKDTFNLINQKVFEAQRNMFPSFWSMKR